MCYTVLDLKAHIKSICTLNQARPDKCGGRIVFIWRAQEIFWRLRNKIYFFILTPISFRSKEHLKNPRIDTF